MPASTRFANEGASRSAYNTTTRSPSRTCCTSCTLQRPTIRPIKQRSEKASGGANYEFARDRVEDCGANHRIDEEVPDRHEAHGFRDYALLLFFYNTKNFLVGTDAEDLFLSLRRP